MSELQSDCSLWMFHDVMEVQTVIVIKTYKILTANTEVKFHNKLFFFIYF